MLAMPPSARAALPAPAPAAAAAPRMAELEQQERAAAQRPALKGSATGLRRREQNSYDSVTECRLTRRNSAKRKVKKLLALTNF
jgi:hypothetical protein